MKQYIKLAVRNIRKQKTGSLINIFGLSMSLAVCLIIILFVRSEFSYDRFQKNYSGIYRLLLVGESTRVPTHAIVFNESLKTGLGELNKGTMVFSRGSDPQFFKYENTDFMLKNVVFTNPGFFEVFSIDLIQGSPATALDGPNKILISESASKKIFGQGSPLGKMLKYENSYDFEVSGVYRDLPNNTHLHADVLVSIEALKTMNPFMTTSFDNTSTQFYYLLPANTDLRNLEKKITATYKKAVPKSTVDPVYQLQPLSKIHLYSADTTWDNADKGSIMEVRTFIIIAILILCIACFNYINLTTALSGKRSVRTGIQKVMGADRRSIFISSFTETLLLDLTCGIVAILLVILSFPGFNSIMGSSLSSSDIDWIIVLIFIGLVIFTLICTSLYQSWNLAGISPISVLNRNSISSIPGRKYSLSGLSKLLSVMQIAITIALIISVITVYKQTTLVMNQKLGFNKSQLVFLENPWDDNIAKRYSLLKEQLTRLPEVKGVGASWNAPGENINNYGGVELTERGKESRRNFGQLPVDQEFLDVLGVEILKGRNFDPALSTDSSKVVINRAGMEALGLTDPIGQKVKNNFVDSNTDYEIIGVVENVQYQALREKSIPAIYYLRQDGLYKVAVRLQSQNLPESMHKLERIWNDIAPDIPIKYQFADQMIQTNYQKEIRTRSLLSVMAFLAIAISMLGIFGLGVFTAQKRTKEIGIRKVNGARVWEVMAMLNKEFILWVAIAFVIATPVAWFIMNRWLQSFACKTSLSWWIFALAGLMALVIALITVSWQSWRAATRNPVESLRYE